MAITKVAALNTNTTLIFGNAGVGKSTAAIKQLPKEAKVLWVAFSNTQALKDAKNDWDLLVPSSWVGFKADLDSVLKPYTPPAKPSYDAVVIDGLNLAAAMALVHIAGSASPTQANWGDMSELIRDTLIMLRDRCPIVVATVDLVPNADGTRQMDFNRYTSNLVLPIFANKFFAHTIPVADKAGAIVGVNYHLQTNTVLALNQIPVKISA